MTAMMISVAMFFPALLGIGAAMFGKDTFKTA